VDPAGTGAGTEVSTDLQVSTDTICRLLGAAEFRGAFVLESPPEPDRQSAAPCTARSPDQLVPMGTSCVWVGCRNLISHIKSAVEIFALLLTGQ
jgi:hypothetical protein